MCHPVVYPVYTLSDYQPLTEQEFKQPVLFSAGQDRAVGGHVPDGHAVAGTAGGSGAAQAELVRAARHHLEHGRGRPGGRRLLQWGQDERHLCEGELGLETLMDSGLHFLP